jgi:hypothetical protein
MKSTQPEAAQQESTNLKQVGEGRFPKVRLIEPTHSGYVLISAEVDRRLGFLPNSRKKRRLIAECKQLCRQLTQDPSVLEAVVFDGIFITPGEDKEFLEKRRPGGRFPDFDLSVLIETSNPEAAATVKESALYVRMERAIRQAANDTFSITATNPKRMGPVDHSRSGSFLINYFVAEDTEQMLAVWEYTAGCGPRRPAWTTPPCCSRARASEPTTQSSTTAAGITSGTSCPPSSSSALSGTTCLPTSTPTTSPRGPSSTGSPDTTLDGCARRAAMFVDRDAKNRPFQGRPRSSCTRLVPLRPMRLRHSQRRPASAGLSQEAWGACRGPIPWPNVHGEMPAKLPFST